MITNLSVCIRRKRGEKKKILTLVFSVPYFSLHQMHLFLRRELQPATSLYITLDPSFPFPDSAGGIFPGPATTQGIEWFSQLAGLQWLTVLSMLIRGITITLTGDWHSGRLAALSPSIMLCNSLLTEGKIRHISFLGMWWLTKIMFQLLNTIVT